MNEQEFLEAIKAGDDPAVAAALADAPDLARVKTANGLSAVLLAYYYGKPAIGRRLADAHDDLTIWEATVAGRAAQVASLLDAQPDLVDAHGADGFTPLGLAAFFGRLDLLALLLARGADPDRPAENSMRVRPIHSAAAQREPAAALAAVDLLLAYGAQVNVAQHGGWTPLMQAADHDNRALVQRLLAAGSVPAARAEDGRTAHDLALERGFVALAELLAID